MKIAIVVSQFNEFITGPLLDGAIERLKERNIDVATVPVTQVPGAVEIPLAAQQYARSRQFDAVICLGAVIRGETTHYDYVCNQVSNGCQQVALQHNIPIIFGVLTTENKEQALDRVGGAHGHKGRDAVDAAFQMMSVMQKLKNGMPHVCEA